MSSNNDSSPTNEGANRPRRSSVTSQTFTNLFGRANSTSGGPTAPFPSVIASAAQDQRRRMSITTLGLSGTSPTQSGFTFGGRRGSVSTAGSESIDENAIEDDDGPARSNPTTPFVRRMSFGAQALRTARTGNSPGSGEGSGFNWSDQLRSRAESSVSQNQRPSFSTSPNFAKTAPIHDRAASVSEMPAPPTVVPAPAPAPPARKPAPRKPDAMQERILKGDFYMD